MRYSISLIRKDFIYDTDYVLWKVCGAIAIHTWDMGGLGLPCRSNCYGTVLCILTRDHHGICLGVNILIFFKLLNCQKLTWYKCTCIYTNWLYMYTIIIKIMITVLIVSHPLNSCLIDLLQFSWLSLSLWLVMLASPLVQIYCFAPLVIHISNMQIKIS